VPSSRLNTLKPTEIRKQATIKRQEVPVIYLKNGGPLQTSFFFFSDLPEK
jgi:hypothetical protein